MQGRKEYMMSYPSCLPRHHVLFPQSNQDQQFSPCALRNMQIQTLGIHLLTDDRVHKHWLIFGFSHQICIGDCFISEYIGLPYSPKSCERFHGSRPIDLCLDHIQYFTIVQDTMDDLVRKSFHTVAAVLAHISRSEESKSKVLYNCNFDRFAKCPT